jgi:hypothetical protein
VSPKRRKTVKEIIDTYNSERTRHAAKAKWAKMTPEQRSAHGRMMAEARHGKKRKTKRKRKSKRKVVEVRDAKGRLKNLKRRATSE